MKTEDFGTQTQMGEKENIEPGTNVQMGDDWREDYVQFLPAGIARFGHPES